VKHHYSALEFIITKMRKEHQREALNLGVARRGHKSKRRGKIKVEVQREREREGEKREM
jgi:hypothetical protein